MLLQSHQSFVMLGDYDPTTDTLRAFSKTAEPERAACLICGTFGILGRSRVLLYRLNGALYLQIDDQRMPLDGHRVEVVPANGRRLLRVRSGADVILELEYDPPQLDPPLSADPTAFAEEEDFDFGLFIANISQDRGRQVRIYT